MNRDEFFFHDLSKFPIVAGNHRGAPEGYSINWIREMEMLVDNPRTFVMVGSGVRLETELDDGKAIVQWKMANKKRLKSRCRAFIAVLGDPTALGELRRAAREASHALGMPFLAVATAAEAAQCARELLGLAGPAGFALD